MTFYAWLLEQSDRDDPVGDLARDTRDDRIRLKDYCPHPTKAQNHRGIRRHMAQWHHACDAALAAVDAAYEEYRALAG